MRRRDFPTGSEDIGDLLNDLVAKGFEEYSIYDTFQSILADLQKINVAQDTLPEAQARVLTQKIYEQVDRTVKDGQLEDKETRKPIRGLTVFRDRELGKGGQAKVFEGELDLSRADYRLLGVPILAWNLADEAVKDGEIEPYQKIRKMQRTFLPRARRKAKRTKVKDLQSMVRESWESHESIVTNGVMPVAVKLSNGGLHGREERELLLAGRLHPNCIYILNSGKTTGDRGYLVMNKFEGLIPHDEYFSALTYREKFQAAIDVMKAVRDLALEGGYHRDIKPSNVLIARRAPSRRFFNLFQADPAKSIRTVVTDFGVMRFDRTNIEQDSYSLVTAHGSGAIIGTLDYMSQNQAVASDSTDIVDDIFSAGCTLYNMWTGRTPNHNIPIKENNIMRRLSNTMYRKDRPYAPNSDKYIALVLAGMMQQERADSYAVLGPDGKPAIEETCTMVLDDLESLKRERPPEHIIRILKSRGVAPEVYVGKVFEGYKTPRVLRKLA